MMEILYWCTRRLTFWFVIALFILATWTGAGYLLGHHLGYKTGVASVKVPRVIGLQVYNYSSQQWEDLDVLGGKDISKNNVTEKGQKAVQLWCIGQGYTPCVWLNTKRDDSGIILASTDDTKEYLRQIHGDFVEPPTTNGNEPAAPTPQPSPKNNIAEPCVGSGCAIPLNYGVDAGSNTTVITRATTMTATVLSCGQTINLYARMGITYMGCATTEPTESVRQY